MEVEYRWGINFAVFDQYPAICEQEAQLSQRNRATFRVIEYFVKSPKITPGYSKSHC